MTQQQFDNWRDFAIRMSRTAFPHKRNPNPARIEQMVTDFFDEFEQDAIECVRNWDRCDEYPAGNPSCKIDGYYWHKGERVACMAKPLCVGDMCRSLDDRWIRNYWSLRYECQFERAERQWCDPPVICIRSGLDVACEPSAGVLGYTVGTLRKMWPEGLPDWVNAYFETPIDSAPSTAAVWL